MLEFVLGQIPWNAISNLKRWRSYYSLHGELILLSTCTLSTICRREYSVTVDAIKQQLPSINQLSFALDGWTSMKKWTITWVITYYMDPNCALQEVPVTFDDVEGLFSFSFEFGLRIIGQWSTYRSQASDRFEGGSGAFQADQGPFPWN